MGWAYSLWCGPSPPAPWLVGGCPCASQITPPKRCFICPRHNQAWTMHHSHLHIANDLTHSRCPSAPHLCRQPLPRAEAPPRLHRHQYESPTILPCLWWEGGQEVNFGPNGQKIKGTAVAPAHSQSMQNRLGLTAMCLLQPSIKERRRNAPSCGMVSASCPSDFLQASGHNAATNGHAPGPAGRRPAWHHPWPPCQRRCGPKACA